MLPPDSTTKRCNTLYLAEQGVRKGVRTKLLVLLLLFFRKVLPPACHLERSPPEIPPSLCSVLLRSSTPLRFAQNDTGGRSRNPKGERQRRSDLAGRLKPALWKTPVGVSFLCVNFGVELCFI